MLFWTFLRHSYDSSNLFPSCLLSPGGYSASKYRSLSSQQPIVDPTDWVVVDSIRESLCRLSVGRPMSWYFTALNRRLTLACQRLRRVSPSLSRFGDVSDIGPPLVRVKAFLLTHSVLNLPGHARDKSNPSLHTAVGKKS